ncbi:MAG: M16 family metallopeptidase [Elusimicrobiota bacterium]
MKIVLFAILSLVLPSFIIGAPPKVDIPALDYIPPQPERVLLSNGAVVYLRENHDLPVFNLSLSIRTSPADQPDKVPDAFVFLGDLWRSGGTKNKTPDKLNEALESQAISIEMGVDFESMNIGLSCLTDKEELGLQFLKEILFEPAFERKQLELSKLKSLEGLKIKNDQLTGIGRRAIRDLMYGKNHPFAHSATAESIARVQRSHLIDLHKKILSPENTIISVSGDFDSKSIVLELEKIFSQWKKTSRVVPVVNLAPKPENLGPIVFVQKDVPQSWVLMVRMGIFRNDPDRFALEVANQILGGGGASRLFTEVRSRLGLTYGIYSFFTEPQCQGVVGIGAQTASGTTIDLIKATQKEVNNFLSNDIDSFELNRAKDSLINAFSTRFETSGDIVGQWASLEILKLDPDFLKTYTQKIRAVTKDEVKRVSQKYFLIEGSQLLVVGDKNKFKGSLEELGKVTDLPLEKID